MSLITTKASLTAFQDCIPWQLMPQTFREAITVCQQLHIPYLWIDSICIIQDDEGDWNHEAALMASVYANAYVTLAATASEDSAGGLFRERGGFITAQLQLPARSGLLDDYDQKEREVFFFPDSLPADVGLLPLQSLLFQRAWTLQECILSRRVVHFTTLQLVWQCWSEVRHEDSLFVRARDQSFLPISISSPADIRRSWGCWVNDYSRRKLSRDEDRMAALAGLTKFIQGLNQDEPLLGLWRNDLALGLLWERGVWDGPASRRRISAFPTWTWMSLPGPAQYPDFQLTTNEIELVQSQIRWAGEPLTSSLERAELVLRGKVLPGTLTTRGRASTESFASVYLEGTSRAPLYERVDLPDSRYDNDSVYYIPIGATSMHWFFIIALLVDSERNAYARIGRAYSPGDDDLSDYRVLWAHFAGMEPQNIILR